MFEFKSFNRIFNNTHLFFYSCTEEIFMIIFIQSPQQNEMVSIRVDRTALGCSKPHFVV
mgnify:CR=1